MAIELETARASPTYLSSTIDTDETDGEDRTEGEFEAGRSTATPPAHSSHVRALVKFGYASDGTMISAAMLICAIADTNLGYRGGEQDHRVVRK